MPSDIFVRVAAKEHTKGVFIAVSLTVFSTLQLNCSLQLYEWVLRGKTLSSELFGAI